tara:strand:- start:636 stop:1139 length:504 start_codon:yes stop_codon:yes gene_type:complete
VSGEAEINNYLQIKNHYPEHQVIQNLIETVPADGESEIEFATRIEKTFLETLVLLKNPKIIFILGAGADGHTAGIFPLDKKSIQETYRDDLTYVPVHVEGLTIDSRASFTPAWILEHAGLVIGYVVGQSKREILSELNNSDKELHERPAELLKLHKHSKVYTDIDIS